MIEKIWMDSIFRDVLTAKFVMVSQDPKTRKSVRNVPLQPETDEEKENFRQGECKLIYNNLKS